ncbi:MAG: hypothetical protein JXA14_18585, partial [Anaerolineae bacterium]|nr:hypothetical protein [Anaerolineae bacterium]
SCHLPPRLSRISHTLTIAQTPQKPNRELLEEHSEDNSLFEIGLGVVESVFSNLFTFNIHPRAIMSQRPPKRITHIVTCRIPALLPQKLIAGEKQWTRGLPLANHMFLSIKWVIGYASEFSISLSAS